MRVYVAKISEGKRTLSQRGLQAWMAIPTLACVYRACPRACLHLATQISNGFGHPRPPTERSRSVMHYDQAGRANLIPET